MGWNVCVRCCPIAKSRVVLLLLLPRIHCCRFVPAAIAQCLLHRHCHLLRNVCCRGSSAYLINRDRCNTSVVCLLLAHVGEANRGGMCVYPRMQSEHFYCCLSVLSMLLSRVLKAKKAETIEKFCRLLPHVTKLTSHLAQFCVLLVKFEVKVVSNVLYCVVVGYTARICVLNRVVFMRHNMLQTWNDVDFRVVCHMCHAHLCVALLFHTTINDDSRFLSLASETTENVTQILTSWLMWSSTLRNPKCELFTNNN